MTPQLGRANARATFVPIAASAVQALAKAAVGLSIGSLAVLASALDSLLDCGLSTVNLFSIRKAEEPPDPEHPFGHGKAESLAVLLEGIVIAGSGTWLAIQGAAHVGRGREVSDYELGAAVMVFGLLLSFGVSRYLVRRADATGSRILRADSLHYAADVWTSGAILLAMGLQAATGERWIDPALSVAVALGIVWQVRPILRGAVDELMDRDLGGEERSEIERIVAGHAPDILDFHRLRTRRAGPQKTIDVHVVICRDRPFEEAHALVTRLEDAIRRQVPNADVMVHADPCSSAPLLCPGPHRSEAAAASLGAGRVYYESVEELPRDLRASLGADAQQAYVTAFNRAYGGGDSPEAAAAEALRLVAGGVTRSDLPHSRGRQTF
ncbi:MAG: cation diffusion facilitator family transporter [Gemmatimonadetes bacterium]|nr:cation diffusion facilitator family transporter [Gemmatimonadota bacterium]